MFGDTSPRDLQHRNQLSHAQQIVCSGDQTKHPVNALFAAHLYLSDRSVLLGPAENFLHQLAFALANGEARAAAFRLRQPVWPRRIGLIFSYVRHHFARSESFYELLLLVAFVGAHRAGLATFEPIQQHQRRLPSAVLLAWVTIAPTINPFRFSVNRWPK